MDRTRIGRSDRAVPITTREAEALGALRMYAHIYEGESNFAVVGEALGVTRARIRQLAQGLERKTVIAISPGGCVSFGKAAA